MSKNTMCTRYRNINMEFPAEFTKDVLDIIRRIVCSTSAGVLYLKNDALAMYAVSQRVKVTLSTKLPQFNRAVKAAVLEIDVLDELIGYRIITKKDEISVVTGPDFAAVAVHRKNKSLWGARNPGRH